MLAMLRWSTSQYFYSLKFATSKEFWKAVKLVNRQDCTIPALRDDSVLTTSDFGKANFLNNYFYECFNHSFPSLSNPVPLDPSDCPASILCIEEFVREMLYSMNPAKSTGLDGVSAFMLKSTATVIAPSLTKLFNLSISSGSFPSAWKNARITPILKSADPSLLKYYRPISISPIVSKLLERHVYSLVSTFLSDKQFLSKSQWGFIHNRSTISALSMMIHNWSKHFDYGSEVCSVFFDVRKAFDSFPNCHLLNKLSKLQLDPHILHWIHSYLTDRSQVVAVSGVQSSPVNVVSGVPQGSVLGPLYTLSHLC